MGNPKKNGRVDVWELHAAIISILSTRTYEKKEGGGKKKERFSDMLFVWSNNSLLLHAYRNMSSLPELERFTVWSIPYTWSLCIRYASARFSASAGQFIERGEKQARVLASARNGFVTRRGFPKRRRVWTAEIKDSRVQWRREAIN